MQSKIFVAIVGFIVGLGSGYIVFAQMNASDSPVIQEGGSAMHHEMAGMMAGLSGKTGDAFDMAFLTEMIVHHEGAVDMAEAALASASHEEIKAMAKAIIAAQTSEIAQMRAWLSEWYQ